MADWGNHEIRKIVISSGVVTTLCGSTTAGSANGAGAAASFYNPSGLACDGGGNLYLADFGNNEIRKITTITTGIETLTDNLSKIKVYPNPNNGIFTIEIDEMLNEAQHVVSVYNVLGENIYNSEIKNRKSEIDLSKQPDGIYFAQLKTEQGIVSKKIINNK